MAAKKETQAKAKTKASRPTTAMVGGEEKPLARYKLLAGLHIQEDFSAEPVVTKDQFGDEVYTYPQKTYTAGQAVYSTADLVDKFGQEKFLLIGESHEARMARGTGSHTHGDPTPELARKAPTAAPHGQVSTGYSEAVGHNPDSDEPDANPEIGSGKLNEEDALEMEAQSQEQMEEEAESNEEAASRSADDEDEEKSKAKAKPHATRKASPAHGKGGHAKK